MPKKRLTRKPDDPEDARRVDEIEDNFQARSMRSFTATPAVGQLRNKEIAFLREDGTDYLIVRVDGEIKKAALA